RRRRLALVGSVLALCAVLCAMAGAATAAGGHLPGVSLLAREGGRSKLPNSVGFSFGSLPGEEVFGPNRTGHGPVWFGEVQRPNAAIQAASNARWLCV